MEEKDYLLTRRELGRRRNYPVSDTEWDLLRSHHDDAIEAAWLHGDYDEACWDDLLRVAEPIRDALQTAKPRTSHRPDKPNVETVPAQLHPYEILRSELFSEYLGKLASNEGVVRRFRTRILDNTLLSAQQARDFLRSPFAAHRHQLWFNSYKIPMVGHSYRVREEGQDEKGSYSLVELVGQSDAKRSLKDRRPIKSAPWVVVDHKRKAREFDNEVRQIERYEVLPFPGEDGEPHWTLVLPNSVLGYLDHQAQRLLGHYPWFDGDAVWFLLTGEVPYVAPMTMRAKVKGYSTFGPYPETDFNYGLVTLTIEPWISADTVERVYREIQRQFLGKANRPLEEKNRRLFAYVCEKVGVLSMHPTEKRKLGKVLVAEWDRLHPEWSYGEDTRTFWRDYNLARKHITTPEYRPYDSEQD